MNPVIHDRIDELNTLVENNPRYISVRAAAEYLGMDADCLRDSIYQGKCQFGISWVADKNRGIKIPTLPFYLFATCGNLI